MGVDYYEVLGVSKTATADQLKAAYRKQVGCLGERTCDCALPTTLHTQLHSVCAQLHMTPQHLSVPVHRLSSGTRTRTRTRRRLLRSDSSRWQVGHQPFSSLSAPASRRTTGSGTHRAHTTGCTAREVQRGANARALMPPCHCCCLSGVTLCCCRPAEAYDVLSDPNKRAVYDQYGEGGSQQQLVTAAAAGDSSSSCCCGGLDAARQSHQLQVPCMPPLRLSFMVLLQLHQLTYMHACMHETSLRPFLVTHCSLSGSATLGH